jgi:hypothetical protein
MSRKTLKKAPKGARGVPLFLLYPKSYYFGEFKLCEIFYNPRTTPSGRKVCGMEKNDQECFYLIFVLVRSPCKIL